MQHARVYQGRFALVFGWVMPSEINDRLNEYPEVGAGNLRFDYNSLPQPVARFLRGQADRIRRQCTISIIQIGRSLLEAKHHLSHGEFLRWVESEACIPARTAQAYMRVSNWAADKGATVAHLPSSALYLLSAPSTPSDFAAGILSRAEAGEYIVPSVIRSELKARHIDDQREYSDPEIPVLRITEHDSIQLAVTSQRGSGGGFAEIVSILVKGLKPADFARVRDIVIADPQLAQSLGVAFESSAQTVVEQT